MHPNLRAAAGPRDLLAGIDAGLPGTHIAVGATAGPTAGNRQAFAMTPAFPMAPSSPSLPYASEANNVVRPQPPRAVPGRDQSGLWLRNAAAGLCVLAAAAAVVSFTAQYRMVYATRHLTVAAGLEAAIPDAATLVFACLGVAQALHGRRAIRARTLNLASVSTSVFMNAIAAAPGWRNLAVWVMPPVAYALVSDTLIGVVRAWVIARHQNLDRPLARDAATPLAALGGLILWLLRLSVAPISTLAGFRAWALEECPTAPGRRAPRRRSPPLHLHGRHPHRNQPAARTRPRPHDSWTWCPNGMGRSPPSASTPWPRSRRRSPPRST